VVKQLNKESLEKIIQFQKDCRETHVVYIQYYKSFPEEEKGIRSQIAGDTKHHQRCVDGYDLTIDFLEKLIKIYE